MAQLKKVFEPGSINKVRIKNRIAMAPMERGYANMDGSVTQKYIDYVVERAKNGVGLINLESTYIDPAGHGRCYQLGLYSDDLISGHKRLTEAVHKHGAKLAAEIQHAGRQTSSLITGLQPVAPSPVVSFPAGGFIPRELTISEIKVIVQKFAQAARRAKEAGYDMVTIHGAHGYLINAFVSPYTNKRTDEYGGSLENRMRFPLEIYQAVRAIVGNDFAVGYRMSADEFVDGGLTLDETTVLAKKLEAAGIDYLDISAGIYESGHMITATMGMPLGYLVYLAAAIKEIVKVPVFATGRINDLVFAENILENNQADFVYMVRALNADPEMIVKYQKGQMDSICMCMACGKCSEWMLMHQPTSCVVNPAAGREREFELKPAKNKKNVMVIGGGIAGMEAARITRIRGHNVTLYEKDNELGGQVRWASKAKFHEEFFQAARYRIHELQRTGVKVETSKDIKLADVKKIAPDVVVVATGAVPYMPTVPGINSPLVTDSFSLLSGKSKIGKKSVVIGGNKEGLAVAEFLAENGSEVVIIEAADGLALDLGFIRQMAVLARIDGNPAIKVKLKTTVENIGNNEVTLQSQGKLENITGIDSVVFAFNRAPANKIYDELIADGQVAEVYCIGDAVSPREASDAIYEGAVIGRKI